VALVLQPTSPDRRGDRTAAEAGFTLLEVICVVAITAMLAAIALPAMPRATSRPQLESYAVESRHCSEPTATPPFGVAVRS
jgi:prepilin-type N-terminal cleavage/methylation domain-containing protein